MEPDRFTAAALRFVNAQRAVRGMPVVIALPRFRGCIDPIEGGLAPLNCRVSATTLSVKEYPGLRVIPLPALVIEFLSRLDAGLYDDFFAPLAEGCEQDLHRATCASSVQSRMARGEYRRSA
jgi:hypothetical protein